MTKLTIVIDSMETKVVKFKASEMLPVEGQKPMKCVHFPVHVKISSSHILNTPQPRRLTTKLRTVIVSMVLKVVVKFETSEMVHVETRARSPFCYMLKSHSHTY